MSVKNKDPKQHWRCKTVAFRVSPEEDEVLNLKVKTAGMLKQDYIVKRVLEQEITVQPNIKIQRHIINYLGDLAEELSRLEAIPENSYVLDRIQYLLELITRLAP